MWLVERGRLPKSALPLVKREEPALQLCLLLNFTNCVPGLPRGFSLRV